MGLIDSPVLVVYLGVLLLLAVYGLNRYATLWLYFRHARRGSLPRPPRGPLPRVTVQLPVYDEMYVVERLLESVAAIRYPRELLEVQVLDDSDDETVTLVAAAVERLRARGVRIRHLRRGERRGYKAGALAHGLETAEGEFILIFDADFVAPPDILEATLGHFEDPRVGLVQVRWGHLNRDYSAVTEAQALLLDGHFVLEHGARSRSGRFFNFNGTAGIWRRAAIEDAGGWQHDTLTEDLDLSYRAQLRGWRFVYLPGVVAPAELPVELLGIRSQQSRWVKGSIQTCRKLLPRLLRARLPLAVKLSAFFHLTGNFAYPLILLLSLLVFPAVVARHEAGLDSVLPIDVVLFVSATLPVVAFYGVVLREVFGAGCRSRLRHVLAAMAAGIGLSVNNTLAVLEGLLPGPSEFLRTPKYRLEAAGDEWRGKRYRGRASLVPLVELLMATYLLVAAAWVVVHGILGTLPFVLLFLCGHAWIAVASLAQYMQRLAVVRTPDLTSSARA